jgi:AmmeMemoRadiSam system protein B
LAESYVNAPATAAAAGKKWIGGVVPPAGWICSGAIAGQTIAALAASSSPDGLVDVIVVFAAVHTPAPLDVAALDPHDRWDVPGGASGLPEQIERSLIETSSNRFVVDERFHRREHAVEVELPLIQVAWPGALVLPIEVPVIDAADQVGVAVARELDRAGLRAVFLASSDLTHYGPAYRFTPVGVGPEALEWAKDNDRRLLDRVTKLEIDQIVPEARDRLNACGAGAIAAMLAACRERGATTGEVLRHQNSYETLADVHPHEPDNAVGYAAVVIG